MDSSAAIQRELATWTLVLASASPRRRDLLGRTGLRFVVEPADADETMDLALGSAAIAENLALRKARVVAARRAGGGAPCLILGSDTIVVLGGEGGAARRFLEKASDDVEARGMLEALSGTRHRVITGIAIVGLDGNLIRESADHETTWVTMRELSAEEIAAYVASGEWHGKAGAYGIQGTADRFVEALEGGGFDNVVGLPVERTLALIRKACSKGPSGA